MPRCTGEAAMRSLRLYHVYEGEGALTP